MPPNIWPRESFVHVNEIVVTATETLSSNETAEIPVTSTCLFVRKLPQICKYHLLFGQTLDVDTKQRSQKCVKRNHNPINKIQNRVCNTDPRQMQR
jgi:hypothetical protein